MTISVVSEGLGGLESFFTDLPNVAKRAARLAVNDVTRDVGYREARTVMEGQVSFPRGYLNDPSRFRIARFATEDNLEAAVVARQRPTSLARFIAGGQAGRPGVRVQVARGRTREMNRAFLIRLPQGQGPVTDSAFNLGIAIRLAPGETIIGKKDVAAAPAGGGLYLLYGPSVDQVFRSVSLDLSPRIGDELASEFLRQFTRLAGGARA